MVKTISILGCGWLGTALGKRFLTKGLAVKGSVATANSYNLLETTGIQSYHLKIDPDKMVIDYKNFFNTDVLIISLPPRVENVVENFPKQIQQVIPFIRETKIEKVLFISSTSVYESWNGFVREGEEGTPQKPNGQALLFAEKILQALPGMQTTVLRLGGLIGYDRNPGRFLSGKTNVAADTPVNLVHRDDAVQIISDLIEKNIWGEVFNACSPQHPTKKEFYSKAAKISGLPAPIFTNVQENYKIVNSDKLIARLAYNFKYSSPMDYLKELEEWAYRI